MKDQEQAQINIMELTKKANFKLSDLGIDVIEL